MSSDGDKRCSCGAGCVTFGECLRGKALMVGSRDGETLRQRANYLLSGRHRLAAKLIRNAEAGR